MKPIEHQPFTFSVIGTGRVGSCLLRSLPIIGGTCTGIASTSVQEARLRFQEYVVTGSISELEFGDVCFLCIPDDHIEIMAQSIVDTGNNLNGRIFVHVSGAKNSSSLKIIEQKGGITGSFHPLASFKPDENIQIFKNTWISIEGNSNAVKILTDIGHRLGANPQQVDADFKIRLHLTAVIVSNFMSSLVLHASEVIKTDVEDPILFIRQNYASLMQSTLTNIISHGFPYALTGPASRNDINTMQMHKSMLSSLNLENQLYQELSDTIRRFVEIETSKDQ